MKYELIDVTGNRWIHETRNLEKLDSDILDDIQLKVVVDGSDNEWEYSKWRLRGNKVVAYREVD